MKGLTGNTSKKALVTSVKPLAGECYGAAGAMQVVSCVLTMKNSLVPPIANLEDPDPECNLSLVTKRALRKDIHVAMVNSLDTTGNGSCLVLRRSRKQ